MYEYVSGRLYPSYENYEKIYTYFGYTADEFWDIAHA